MMEVDNNNSVPKLKIAILVVGSRGDVQPFLAVAKKLQEYGHYVRLATHSNFSGFVKSAGIDFYPIAGDPRVLVGYLARNKGIFPSRLGEVRELLHVVRQEYKVIVESLLPACTKPDPVTGEPFRAQAIIANIYAYGHALVGEALGVPVHIFYVMPYTPTNVFPHSYLRIPIRAAYKLSYNLVDLVTWWLVRGSIIDFWKNKLTTKLANVTYFNSYHVSISHLPTVYLWSPHIVPKPNDWGSLVDVVGYSFLNDGVEYHPPDDFVEWIQSGTKPIYIGFGSMPIGDSKKITNVIFEALIKTGQRGIIDKGWGDLGAHTSTSENVFVTVDCPHDWLFPQCLAVVHHGGAGTTAAGLKAGCPTVIVPFFGDQFFWGERIHEKGVGPTPIPISNLNVESLSEAIRFLLQPEVKSRAMGLALCIENEDGAKAAVDAFHRHLLPKLSSPTPSSDEEDSPLCNGF